MASNSTAAVQDYYWPIWPLEAELAVMQSFASLLCLAISVCGIFGNVINVVVFVRMGVKDSMNLTLLWFSAADLLHVFVTAPLMGILHTLDNLPRHLITFDYRIPYVVSAAVSGCLSSINTGISVFLGLARCLCVARPLKFKSMLTRGRTLFVLAFITVASFLVRLPYAVSYEIVWGWNWWTNKTQWVVQRAPHQPLCRLIGSFVNGNIIPWSAYIIVIVCVVILAIKLSQASKKRSAMMSTPAAASGIPEATADPDLRRKGGWNLNNAADAPPPTGNKGFQAAQPQSSVKQEVAATKMSGKDIQVIKSVILICGIFIATTTSWNILSALRLVAELAPLSRQSYMYVRQISELVIIVGDIMEQLNLSLNIFVYYNYNTKYRNTFKSLFKRRR